MDSASDIPADAKPSAASSGGEIRFPCGQCGAKLVFRPGTASLTCAYCGHANPIPASQREIHELDYRTHLARLADSAERIETPTVQCTACGAEVDRPEHTTALACPFCDTDIVVAAASHKRLKPRSLLPFRVRREQARTAIGQWLKSLWFAPSALKTFARLDRRLNGMYVPYWTYDCRTISRYSGERGDDYWDTETYTTTENGRTVSKTRQVRRTRWTWVSGVVQAPFDDVPVIASHSLPRKHTKRLEPWDLDNLVPYADEYLSGFRAESYQVNLVEGFDVAKQTIDDAIYHLVESDIGGDHQRVHSIDTQYEDITFKHLLLPLWITAYRFRQTVYRVLVNARTGEVQGQRPWSWIKIALLVLLLAGLGTAAYLVFAAS